MTTPELIELFNIRYEFIASQDAPGYSDDEILLLLNEANNILFQQYYESGAERSEDIQNKLGELFQEFDVDMTSATISDIYGGKIAAYPWNGVGYVLSGMIDTGSNSGIPVKAISHDQFNANKKHPYKKPYEDLCWKLKIDGDIILVYEDSSAITRYYGAYLRFPASITVVTTSELSEIVHYDLVDLAVKLAYDRSFRNK